MHFREFTGDEGLALLEIMYAKIFVLTSVESAYTAARFAHKYVRCIYCWTA